MTNSSSENICYVQDPNTDTRRQLEARKKRPFCWAYKKGKQKVFQWRKTVTMKRFKKSKILKGRFLCGVFGKPRNSSQGKRDVLRKQEKHLRDKFQGTQDTSRLSPGTTLQVREQLQRATCAPCLQQRLPRSLVDKKKTKRTAKQQKKPPSMQEANEIAYNNQLLQ